MFALNNVLQLKSGTFQKSSFIKHHYDLIKKAFVNLIPALNFTPFNTVPPSSF